MDAQRRAASGKPPLTSTKKRPFGSDLTGSSARGSEDRSSVAPQPPRGTKRSREIEGIDKVSQLFHCLAGPRESWQSLERKLQQLPTDGRRRFERQVPHSASNDRPSWHLGLATCGLSCGDSAMVLEFVAHTLRSGVTRRPCLNFSQQTSATKYQPIRTCTPDTDNMSRKKNSYDGRQSDSSFPTPSNLFW